VAKNLTGAPFQRRDHLLENTAEIARVLDRVKRVAVIGIKPEEVGGPAFYVPELMQRVGYEIVPVPVYYPDITEILGVPVHRSLSTVSPAVDMVLLFRRPSDVPLHLQDILAHKPSVVWMQLGIRHDDVAQQLADAGIAVIQDRCVKVELERMRL
jgi:predicted CoA-binding protein